MFPLTNTNSSSVSRNNTPLVSTCAQTHTGISDGIKVVCLKLIVGNLSVSLQDEEVILQNPADVLVYVQVLPLALLPNPSVFSGKLADR